MIALMIQAVGLSGIAAVLLIVIFVGREALPILRGDGEAGFDTLFLPQPLRPGKPPGFMWQPVGEVPKLSMIPLLLGTLKVTLVAMVVAVPVALAAALFTSEFAPRRIRELLKPVIELLASIPSVVLGFFALMTLAGWAQSTFGLPSRLSALVAGLAMAIAIVPVVFTVAEDALTAVPRSYREASLALGATPWETAWRVVLPAAAPGVFAACVLGFGRAIGETMIVLMASGNAAIVSLSLSDSTRTMSATIAAEMGEVVFGGTHWSVLFFIGLQLFALTLALNWVAGAFVRRTLRRMGGTA
ncbi:MAG: phosphate ABC transporter permease subunit PstC [Archangium sp.]|nr:phosphate ABC transporter permease subunit PstC [Archangium sp.]